MTSRATRSRPSHTSSGCLTSFRNLPWFQKPIAVQRSEAPLEDMIGALTLPTSTTVSRLRSQADDDRGQEAMCLQYRLVTVEAEMKTYFEHCKSRFKPTDQEWIDACSGFEEVRQLRKREEIFDYTTGVEVDVSQVEAEEKWIRDATEVLGKPRPDLAKQCLERTVAKNDEEAARAAASARRAAGGLGSLDGSMGEGTE